MCIVFTIELNHLLPCFGLSALYLRKYVLKQLNQPAVLASLNSDTGTVILGRYGRGQLGSIRLKTSQLPAISFLALLILWF